MDKPTMFLTQDDLRELTNRIHHSKQALVLRSMGIEHRIRPDGTVAVLRQHVEQVLGVVTESRKKAAAAEPDWGALHATRTKQRKQGPAAALAQDARGVLLPGAGGVRGSLGR
ncbi:MAG: DUF4224 domain-containing protein [Pseudomonadota bacterium]